MALKAIISTADYDKLPDVLKSEYQQDGDQWILVLDDKDFRTEVTRFKENNRALQKEHERLKKEMEKYRDIDPEAYQQALEAQKKLEELDQSNLLKDGKLDEVLTKRTETMRQDYEKRLLQVSKGYEDLGGKHNKLREDYRQLKINGAIRDAVSKVGNVRIGAMEDVLNRASRAYKLDDNDELTTEMYNDKGEPMAPEEWAKRLMTDSPYLFEPAQGGGAKGSGSPAQPRGAAGQKVLNAPSPMEFGRNLDAIAAGKVTVNPASTGSAL